MRENPVRIGKVRLKGGLTVLPFPQTIKSDAYKLLSESITRHGEFNSYVLITIDKDGYFSWSFTLGDPCPIPPSVFVDKAKRIIDSIDGPC